MTAITLTHGQLALFVTMIRKRGRKMLATLTEDQAGNVSYHVSRLGRLGGMGQVCAVSYAALRARLWGHPYRRGPMRAFVSEPVT